MLREAPDASLRCQLAEALDRTLALWRQPAKWKRIQANGMARQFGWEDSALQYLEVYQRALLRARGAPETPPLPATSVRA